MRRRLRALLVATAAALAGGCVALPPAQRPAVAVPEAWNESTAAADATTVHRDWWTTFGSATLSSLVDQSLRESHDLAAAAARVDEARAQARVSGAAQFPTLDARTSVARSRGSGTDRQQLFLEAGYELDFWGRYRAIARSADALADASALDRDTLQLALEASVSNAYFRLLGLRERESLARSILGNARRLLDLVGAQVAGGIASELELAQQANIVAAFEAALASLEQQQALIAHELAVLVGHNPEGLDLADQDRLARITIPQVRAGLPSDLLRQRPDLQATEARLRSAHFDIVAARAAFFPDIALTGEAGHTSASIGRLLSGGFFTAIAMGAVQPLFEGGRLEATLGLDRARERELVASYRKSIAVAFQDVEDALSSMARLADIEAADRRAVDAARRAEELALLRFRYGTVAFVTVLDSQRVRYQSEDALLQVRLARLQASVGFYRALGGGFGDDRATPVALVR